LGKYVPHACKQSRQGGIFFRDSEITGHFQYTSSSSVNEFGDDPFFIKTHPVYARTMRFFDLWHYFNTGISLILPSTAKTTGLFGENLKL
jgi:hypothetical protein